MSVTGMFKIQKRKNGPLGVFICYSRNKKKLSLKLYPFAIEIDAKIFLKAS
jgi:hypothetical protein